MSLAKFNKSTINWNIDTKDWKFKKAMELDKNTEYALKGIFFTPDNGYGEGVVIISDGFLVNCPKGFEEQARAIVADPDSVEAIKAGTEKFKVSTYVSKKFKKECADIVLL